jgi:hypothetical protein
MRGARAPGDAFAMNRVLAAGLLLFAGAGLQACCFRSCEPVDAGDAMGATSAAAAAPLAITDWGPRRTPAGVAFNVQDAGRAAVWIRVDQPLDGSDVLVQFGDAYLAGQAAGGLVTAMVPPESYARPGRYDVRVLARNRSGRRDSNTVVFTVEQAAAHRSGAGPGRGLARRAP